jgi:hypothetical protein
MNEPKDPQEYNNPNKCKWEKDGMKCEKTGEHKGYCVEHIKKVDPDYTLGAATGAGIAGLISSNPIGLVVGIALGVGLVVYLAGKSK